MDFLNQIFNLNKVNKSSEIKEFPKLETDRLILRKVDISDLLSTIVR